jgi:hypothetical protein
LISASKVTELVVNVEKEVPEIVGGAAGALVAVSAKAKKAITIMVGIAWRLIGAPPFPLLLLAARFML